MMTKTELEAAVKAGANLQGANLQGANLQGAHLEYANLQRANLEYANLQGANLGDANLQGANLEYANLQGANLQHATVDDKTVLPSISILPDGDIIGWKKLCNGLVAKLLIPAKAKRINSTGRKCRAEYVKVIAVFINNRKTTKVGIGKHDYKTKYITGKITRPDKYDPDWRVECSHGIHFFITRKEAEEYN